MNLSNACARLLVGLALLLACPPARAADYASLNAKPVPLADGLHVGGRTGRMRFLGMLAIPRAGINGLRFAQLSDLGWDDDDGVLYAISDKGALFHMRPVFSDGVLADVKLVRAVPLRELETGDPLRGRRADGEGLAVLHGRNGRPHDAELVVSFERFPRIVRYRPDGRALAPYPLPAPLLDTLGYQSSNSMLEAVCVHPTLGILTISEAPRRTDPRGFNRLHALSGASWLYPVENENRMVGLACLDNGDVLVLERDYGRLLWRSLVSLKRVRPAHAAPGTTLEAQTLMTLNSRQGFQIDNFEGVAQHRGNRFFLVSDDNDLFLQRTLLMYFELLDEEAPAPAQAY